MVISIYISCPQVGSEQRAITNVVGHWVSSRPRKKWTEWSYVHVLAWSTSKVSKVHLHHAYRNERKVQGFRCQVHHHDCCKSFWETDSLNWHMYCFSSLVIMSSCGSLTFFAWMRSLSLSITSIAIEPASTPNVSRTILPLSSPPFCDQALLKLDWPRFSDEELHNAGRLYLVFSFARW